MQQADQGKADPAQEEQRQRDRGRDPQPGLRHDLEVGARRTGLATT